MSRRKLADQMDPLALAFNRVCESHPTRVAFVQPDLRVTYDQLSHAVEHVVNDIDVRPRDVVYVSPSGRYDDLVILMGLLRIGAVVVLGDPAWDHRELQSQASQLACNVVLTPQPLPLDDAGSGFNPITIARWKISHRSAGAPPTFHPDCSVVRFTSGSTGSPKALQFSSARIVMAANTWRGGINLKQEDSLLCCCTINNGLAFNCAVIPALLTGAKTILPRTPFIPSNLVTLLEAERATILVAPPVVYELMSKASPTLLRGLLRTRLRISSSGPIPEAVHKHWRRVLRRPINNYYGIAELGPITIPSDGLNAVEHVGKLLPGVSVELKCDDNRDRGRVLAWTPYMTLGAVSHSIPSAAHEADPGFHETSDIAQKTTDGDLFLYGRCDDVINVGGRKYNTRTIEGIITGQTGQTCVVSAFGGENPRGFQVIMETPDPSKQTWDIRTISKFVPGGFPIAKVQYVKTIPRSSVGKIRRNQLNDSGVKQDDL